MGMVHTSRLIAGISDTTLNIPLRTPWLISSGLAVTEALMEPTSRSTIMYMRMIKEVESAAPSLVTKL